jgi:carbon-monoxide dehydrogenase medium subunit
MAVERRDDPHPLRLQRASSVEEAVGLLKQPSGKGRLLSGWHSLIPLMKLRLSEAGVLIDIGRLPGLSGISEAAGRIMIGAMTTYHAVAKSGLLRG